MSMSVQSNPNPLVTDATRSKVPLMGVILLIQVAVVTAAVVGAAVAAIRYYLVYAILAFPAIMGFLAGGAISRAAKIGRVRSVGVVTLFAVLTGLLMYGIYRYGDYFLTRQYVYNVAVDRGYTKTLTPEQIQTKIDDYFVQEGGAPGFIGFVNYNAKLGEGIRLSSSYSSSNTSPLTFTLTGTAAWIYWGVEILLIVGLAAVTARKAVNIPFCEKDSRYFANVILGRVPRESADQFLMQAKASNWRAAAALIAPGRGKVVYPYLAVVVQKCPDCNTNDAPLKVVRKLSSRSKSDRTVLTATLTPAQYDDLSGTASQAAMVNPMSASQGAR